MYNRTLAYVYTPNGINVNEQMCREGWNRWYPFQKGCESYETFDTEAAGQGLKTWSDPEYILPWKYRHGK
jgi:endonuclease YncB( thermonuclease family)